MRFLLSCTILLISGCSTFQGLFSEKKVKKPSYFSIDQEEAGHLRGPCVNLPFIDQNYPEHLNLLINLYEPKVDAFGAYKVTILMLKEEKKRKDYAIDTKSAKICENQNEKGYSFRVIKVKAQTQTQTQAQAGD